MWLEAHDLASLNDLLAANDVDLETLPEVHRSGTRAFVVNAAGW